MGTGAEGVGTTGADDCGGRIMGPDMGPTIAPAGVGGRPRIGIVGLCKDGDIGWCGLNPGWNPPITGLKGMYELGVAAPAG